MEMIPIESSILISYAVTIISETAIILTIQRPKQIWQWIAGIILINSLTQPIAVYLILIWNISRIAVEFGVFAIEAIWYWLAFRISPRRALVISATANLVSIFTGFSIRLLFK